MADTIEYESRPRTDPSTGVLYRPENSPGMFIRCIVAAMDVTVVVLLVILASLLWPALAAFLPAQALLLITALLCGLYLVGLKVTPIGTVGYRLFGLKLVTIRGAKPSVWRVILRTFLAIWLNPLFDILWMASDNCRQTIRDKVAGTYVIYASARPAGTGRLVYVRLDLFNLHLVYAEVRSDAPLLSPRSS